jgi:transcription elongation factor Elf1
MSRSHVGFLQCSDCGQKSAVTGDASLWERVDTAKSAFECTACGSVEEDTTL